MATPLGPSVLASSSLGEKFHECAESTWKRLSSSEAVGYRLGEETLTDLNLLTLLEAHSPNIRLYQASKPVESRRGVDWEWWIGSGHLGWWRYAVQAKRLFPPRPYRRYESLAHKVGRREQINILNRYALGNQSIPLYCLYNYTAHPDDRAYWHCRLPYDQPQLGCTIAPIQTIRRVYGKKAMQTFESVHQFKEVRPWRCLVCCPDMLPSRGRSTRHPLARGKAASFRPVLDLPAFLGPDSQPGPGPRTFEREVLPTEFPAYYDSSITIYPERILVLDVGG